MDNQEQTDFQRETRWRKDVDIFLFAVFKKWIWWLGATLGSSAVALWQAFGSEGSRMIPSWILWLVVVFGVFVSCFLVWRDQKRLTELKQSQLDAFVIHAAIWGLGDNHRDVTKIALMNLMDGKFEMPLDYRVLGDPIEKTRKNLTVYYSYNGKNLVKVFTEELDAVARLP